MNALEVKGMLRNGVCELIFTKKDGTQRKAKATLVESSIPEENAPRGTGTPYTDSQIRFFDVEIDEWRSCLVDSIVSITPEEALLPQL